MALNRDIFFAKGKEIDFYGVKVLLWRPALSSFYHLLWGDLTYKRLKKLLKKLTKTKWNKIRKVIKEDYTRLIELYYEAIKWNFPYADIQEQNIESESKSIIDVVMYIAVSTGWTIDYIMSFTAPQIYLIADSIRKVKKNEAGVMAVAFHNPRGLSKL